MLRSSHIVRNHVNRFSRHIKCNQRRQCADKPGVKPNQNVEEPLQSSTGGAVLKIVGGVGVVGGLVVAYAWYDPSFRRLIEERVPYSKEAFESVPKLFPANPKQDKMQVPFGKSLDLAHLSAAKHNDSNVDSKTPTVISQTVSGEDLGKKWESPSTVGTKLDKKAEEKLKKEEAQKREAEYVRQKIIEKENEEAAENEALREYIEGLTKKSESLAKVAVEQEENEMEVMRAHAANMKQAIDDSVDIMSKDEQWQSVVEAYKEREGSEAAGREAHSVAQASLDELKTAIAKGKENKITRKNACLLPAQELVNRVRKDLTKVELNVAKTRNEVKMVFVSRDMIDRARQQFKEELESVMPEVVIGDRSAKKLTEEELNMLLVHSYRRINQLQKKIANQVAFEMQRTQEALEEQLADNEIINAEHGKQLLEVQRGEFDVEKEKLIQELSVQHERMLVQELVRQTAAHTEHLRDVLTTQEVELAKSAESRLNEALIQERQSFQAEMSGWIARLRGIEAAVEGRAEQEKAARCAQMLWLACVALNGAIARGNEGVSEWEQQLKPLADPILAIKLAARNNILVDSIIGAIPDVAYTRGVWREDNLCERFEKVRRNCKRVALIDEGDSRTLFRFFISYVQSFFVFSAARAKSADDDIELSELDTFSCLAHANYWLKQGNLANALRFMNNLKGEARSVAGDWIEETRLLLEMKQAAQLLTAFASATGLGTIF